MRPASPPGPGLTGRGGWRSIHGATCEDRVEVGRLQNGIQPRIEIAANGGSYPRLRPVSGTAPKRSTSSRRSVSALPSAKPVCTNRSTSVATRYSFVRGPSSGDTSAASPPTASRSSWSPSGVRQQSPVGRQVDGWLGDVPGSPSAPVANQTPISCLSDTRSAAMARMFSAFFPGSR